MLIELSGIDGSGKSTQIALLQGWCNRAGVPCYERSLRSTVRRVLGGLAVDRGHLSWRGVFDPDAVELATALEMRQLVYTTIMPIRFAGQVIVTDTYLRRWVASAVASGARNLPQLELVYESIQPPDIAIHLAVTTTESLERISRRPQGDHLQREGGTQRLIALADGYETSDRMLAYRPAVLDGTADPESVGSAVRQVIADHVAKSRGDRSIPALDPQTWLVPPTPRSPRSATV